MRHNHPGVGSSGGRTEDSAPGKKTDGKVAKEYYLRERIKAIQKELGDQDDRLAEIDEYQRKIKEQNLPEEVKEKALREVKRLEKMPPMAAEAVVVRNYLDWLLALPWDCYTEDHLDLDAAQKILDEDHYGLEGKRADPEYLAVCRLTKSPKGPIICLIGPPGW